MNDKVIRFMNAATVISKGELNQLNPEQASNILQRAYAKGKLSWSSSPFTSAGHSPNTWGNIMPVLQFLIITALIASAICLMLAVVRWLR